jgi:putative ABC transport system substrate-binding protein
VRIDVLALALLSACLIALAGCSPVVAQPVHPEGGRAYRLGWLGSGSWQPWHDEFKEALRDAGYAEGSNLVIETRYAEGNSALLPDLAAEILAFGPDVILATDTRATAAAQRLTSSVPIVVAVAGDPVGSGFADSLARPGRNVTGHSTLIGPSAKQLEVLVEIQPGTQRIAFLLNPEHSLAGPVLDETRLAARANGVDLQVIEIQTADQLEAAFDTVREGNAQALMVFSDPLFFANAPRLMELVRAAQLPATVPTELLEQGGVAAYGFDLADLFRDSAKFVARVFEGDSPATMPFEKPTRFDLLVNLKAAESLGVDVPPSVLQRAAKVVK